MDSVSTGKNATPAATPASNRRQGIQHRLNPPTSGLVVLSSLHGHQKAPPAHTPQQTIGVQRRTQCSRDPPRHCLRPRPSPQRKLLAQVHKIDPEQRHLATIRTIPQHRSKRIQSRLEVEKPGLNVVALAVPQDLLIQLVLQRGYLELIQALSPFNRSAKSLALVKFAQLVRGIPCIAVRRNFTCLVGTPHCTQVTIF
jgi:hypothetical protein